jgi:hypothetical protein
LEKLGNYGKEEKREYLKNKKLPFSNKNKSDFSYGMAWHMG